MDIPDYIRDNKILIGFTVLALIVGISGAVLMSTDSTDKSPVSEKESKDMDGLKPVDYDKVQKASGFTYYGEVSISGLNFGKPLYNPLDSINDNSMMVLKNVGFGNKEELDTSRLIERNGKKYLAFNLNNSLSEIVDKKEELTIESSGYFQQAYQQSDKDDSLNKYIVGENCGCYLVFNLRQISTSDFKAQNFKLEGSISSSANFLIPETKIKNRKVVVLSQGDYLGEFKLDKKSEAEKFSVTLKDVKKPVQPLTFKWKLNNGTVASATSEDGIYNMNETIENYGNYGSFESQGKPSLDVKVSDVSVVN